MQSTTQSVMKAAPIKLSEDEVSARQEKGRKYWNRYVAWILLSVDLFIHSFVSISAPPSYKKGERLVALIFM